MKTLPMENVRRSLLYLAFSMAAFNCSEHPPKRGTLALHFEHNIEGKNIVLGTEYTTRYGQQIIFDHLRYWISNIEVVGQAGKYVVPGSYFLVEQTEVNDRRTIEVEIPPGLYDKVIIHIGIDPKHNRSLDLLEGELQLGIGMDWDWDTGYKFLRTEGTYKERSITGDFVIHCGNDVLYKKLTGTLSSPFKIIDNP